MTNDGSASKPPGKKRPDIEALFRDGTEIDRALKRGVREALRRHKKLGNSIIVWRDGKVVELPPEEIPD